MYFDIKSIESWRDGKPVDTAHVYETRRGEVVIDLGIATMSAESPFLMTKFTSVMPLYQEQAIAARLGPWQDLINRALLLPWPEQVQIADDNNRAFATKHPLFCRACLGWGSLFDNDGNADPCSECTALGICPWCSWPTLDEQMENDLCSDARCKWSYYNPDGLIAPAEGV